MDLDVSKEFKFQALFNMLNSEGWEILHEHLTRLRQSDMISLAAAKRDLSDDFLRGRISTLTWFLEGLSAEVQEYFQEKHPQQKNGQPASEGVGHPYGPEQEGQPFLEGEDFSR